MKPALSDVLAARYASTPMVEVWSPERKVVLERRLWIAVMEAQRELGVDIPAAAIDDYRAVVDKVDLASIDARERVTRHDVKARLEEFSALAGHEHAHSGMTSRDLTENVEQLQVRLALELVRSRMVTALARLAELAAEHSALVMVGRSHNVAAQATTLGKRFANAGEELLQAYRRIDEQLARYPLRGIKGPVGTQQDQLDLLGDPAQQEPEGPAVEAGKGRQHSIETHDEPIGEPAQREPGGSVGEAGEGGQHSIETRDEPIGDPAQRAHGGLAGEAGRSGQRVGTRDEPIGEPAQREPGGLAGEAGKGGQHGVGTRDEPIGEPAQRLDRLEAAVQRHLGFESRLTNVGQVYPRSLDFDVVSALVQATAGPASLATTIRLMAGHELATEGFAPGQVGSSAMPHKMNTRSCERVNGLAVVVRGYLSMVSELVGDQWNEGDVSCSVVRRVALPDAFLATDGLFETFLSVLGGFGAYPAVVARELDRYLPFLATTKVLVAALRQGVGRETAHEVIKEHAVAAALALREGADNDLVDRLAADGRLGLDRAMLDALLADRAGFVGAAPSQVEAFCAQVAEVVARFPEASSYYPEPVL